MVSRQLILSSFVFSFARVRRVADETTSAPQLACARCGNPLDGWQGKDGPCGLLEWVQGMPSPPRQHVDEEWAVPASDRERFRLPAHFEIYTECELCRAWIEAEGSCEGDVWSRIELVGPTRPRLG